MGAKRGVSGGGGGRVWKQGASSGVKALGCRLSVTAGLLVMCMLYLLTRIREDKLNAHSKIDVEILWGGALSHGWIPSAVPRMINWTSPPEQSNGYLVVRCNGGLNQQRTAICNAVLAARIMSATLVLPELDTNSFWHDKSGFPGIYDVDHFIEVLKDDVKIVPSLPLVHLSGKKNKKLKPFQIRPPRDAPASWYETVALEKMKEHGAIYLTPFSHRLAEDLTNHEYQRLRCRVNFYALKFRRDVMELSQLIVRRLRSEGPFMAIHLRFEMDMLAFAGCLDIFTPEEQKFLQRYREQNFAQKRLVYNERRLIGKCPLTPEEVGLILHALGFRNSTRIYLAAGDIFGGERFLQPLRYLFPRLENRSTIATVDELAAVNAEGRGLLGPAVDYMVCLMADIFMPTYDGPSNFANNLLGHRLFEGFRTTVRPDRKALAPIFIDREKGWTHQFERKIRLVMLNTWFGGPHPRIPPESFYTNPWSECFCKLRPEISADQCPSSLIPDQKTQEARLSALSTERISIQENE